MKDLDWFLSRIGKRVYRSKPSCSCRECVYLYKNGQIVMNEVRAKAMWKRENLLVCKYFDSAEERDESDLKEHLLHIDTLHGK